MSNPKVGVIIKMRQDIVFNDDPPHARRQPIPKGTVGKVIESNDTHIGIETDDGVVCYWAACLPDFFRDCEIIS